ncbi:MAG: Fic family protein [Deltaproteobacteria bacterium]|jgi:hypothetical protein|nr:Fic family protein [Deltaproteobacteria bacterium]
MSEAIIKYGILSDLPNGFEKLSDPAFLDLVREWKVTKDTLDPDLVETFRERVCREWACETGQVEGLYTLDADVMQGIIENGLNSVDLSRQPRGLLISSLYGVLEDQLGVIHSLYKDIRFFRPLTPFTACAVHASFVANQEFAIGLLYTGHQVRVKIEKGVFKSVPNRVGNVECCPPEQVSHEMNQLCKMHEEHLRAGVPVDVAAAWLHREIILIHPFQDGNGRTARALASVEFIRAGLLPPVVTLAGVGAYIEALKAGNVGDLEPLARYLSGLVAKKTRECIEFCRS